MYLSKSCVFFGSNAEKLHTCNRISEVKLKQNFKDSSHHDGPERVEPQMKRIDDMGHLCCGCPPALSIELIHALVDIRGSVICQEGRDSSVFDSLTNLAVKNSENVESVSLKGESNNLIFEKGLLDAEPSKEPVICWLREDGSISA
jgi:hypothetical protein